MAQNLIIGYGNPLRGDDGMGWHAAEYLAQELSDEEAEVLARQQLTVEMAEFIGRFERVIFIDACADAAAGSMRVKRVFPGRLPRTVLLHLLSPVALVTLAKVLYRASPEAFLITVGGRSFDFRETLSSVVAETFPELLETVRTILAASGQELKQYGVRYHSDSANTC